jgi:hypothetical protein
MHATDTNAIEFHPATSIFPPMEGAEFDALVADIKANGLHEPIVAYDGKVLDGCNRLRACEAAGVKVQSWQWRHLNSDNDKLDPAAWVISANLHRRHLTAEQKRDVIAVLIKTYPEKSDRQIAEMVRASPTTVGTVRRELEPSTVQSGQLPPKRVGKDGKKRKQPTKGVRPKPKVAVPKPPPPPPEAAVPEAAAPEPTTYAPVAEPAISEAAAPSEELITLRELARFIISERGRVATDAGKDRADWKALFSRVKQVMGG